MNLTHHPDAQTTTRQVIAIAVYLLLVSCAAWWFAELRFALNREFPLASLQMLAEGTAYQPFQLRVLVPWLAVGGQEIFGGSLTTIYQVLEAIFTALLVFCFYFWLRVYFSGLVAAVLSFLVLIILPFNLLLPRGLFAIRVPYDVSSAMFFALLCALVLRQKWKWLWVIFPLAVLNRESVIFLVAAYALAEVGRSAPRSWLPRAASAVTIWLVIRVGLSLIYQDNPGTMVEFTHVGSEQTHLATNLRVLSSAPGLVHIASSFGFLWCLPLLFFRRITSRYLRYAFLMLPLYFLGIVFIGNVHEIRKYAEWTPVVLMGVIQVICRIDPGGRPIKSSRRKGKPGGSRS